jgi:solute carrier family 25 (adenine nucleotide translocator) protein 4/5/6/31
MGENKEEKKIDAGEKPPKVEAAAAEKPAKAEGEKPAKKEGGDKKKDGKPKQSKLEQLAPVERVKLLMQTQDSNPKVISGEVPRYTGIVDCFRRVNAEQGLLSFWRGNLVNCLRYAPQQGSALAFNDLINNMFPNYDSKTQFWQSMGAKLFSGGLAGAIANTVCYPFDFARTRLASDVGKGKAQFKGITDCIVTTVR